MARFRFPLERVLEWYRTQSSLEEERLRLCADAAAHAVDQLEHHRRDSLARQMEVLGCSKIQASELAALGSYRRRSKQLDLQLRQNCQNTGQALERQRGAALVAQRRLRLMEKLRDRRLAEHEYETARELEALASETFLAAYARGLTE